ncbi:hypothetical protein GCM10009576_099280 [Streptomyces rhizosphaericus]|uniref:Uncharacterized protein n=1 Tax=Streptomyces rhizosphaericus TaxID=114699 RepID=A0ABN1TC93_9ACTN
MAPGGCPRWCGPRAFSTQESWPPTNEGKSAKFGYGGVSGSIRRETPKKIQA